MKKTLLLSILAALLFNTRAHATLDGNFPFHFNYTVGDNLIGNSHWVKAGPGGDPQPKIVSGNLNICGLAAASGASVSFGGNGTSARCNLNTSYTSGNLYYSFILKITDISSLSAGGGFFAGFNNTSGSQSTTPTVVGTKLYAKKSGSGYLLGLLKANGTTVWDDTVHYVNETLFIVGGYTFGGAARLWINPTQFGGSAPGATLSDNSGTDISGPTIASFVLFDRDDNNEPTAMILDELYVGTAWADVTPAGSPALAFTSTKNDVTGCNGNANGSITVTPTDGFGPGPLQFSKDGGINWVSDANSSHTFGGLAANSYNIQVKDANGGCTVSSTVTLTQPAAVTINSITLTNVSCNGGSNGSISVAASGGTGALQFSGNGGSSWSAGTSPYTFSGLPAGSNYNIRVKDANGCTVVYSGNPVAITQPPVLTVSAVAVTNVTCHGAGNGSIKVTVSGGAGEP